MEAGSRFRLFFILVTGLIAGIAIGSVTGCAPSIESQQVAAAPTGFESQEKSMQDGLAAEARALAGLNADFINQLNAWKAMPLKNCTTASLLSSDPLNQRQIGNNTPTELWDVRTLFERTQGSLVAVTTDYFYLIDVGGPDALRTESIESARLVSSFSESRTDGKPAQIELRQGTTNCFIVVDDEVAYQTVLLPKVQVTSFSNLNPVFVPKRGGNKLSDGPTPHKISAQMRRDVFPFRSQLGLTVDTRIPAGFLKGDASPARPDFYHSLETTKQFLNFLNPSAFDNYPSAQTIVNWQAPNLTNAGLMVDGVQLKTPAVIDQMKMILSTATDPFQADVVRMQYNFRGPGFKYAFLNNESRRAMLLYGLEFLITGRTGTDLAGQWTGVFGRVEPLRPVQQTQCFVQILTQKPFDTNSELRLAQLTDACRNFEVDSVRAYFQPEFINLMMTEYDSRAAMGPRVSDNFVNEVSLGILRRFGDQALPEWWKVQKDWRFRESAKANGHLMLQASKSPELVPYLAQIADIASLYPQVFQTSRFSPQVLDKLVSVVTRLKPMGFEIPLVLSRYKPALWAEMSETDISMFIEGTMLFDPARQAQALDNPKQIVAKVLADRADKERRLGVQKQIAEFDSLLGQLSPTLRHAATSENLLAVYSTYAERASLNQINNEHKDRVSRVVQILKTLVLPETRLDPAAAEAIMMIRQLLQTNPSVEDYRFLEALLGLNRGAVNQYLELRQIFGNWGVQISREQTLQISQTGRSVEIARHLSPLRIELGSKSGLQALELLSVTRFIVEKYYAKPDLTLNTATDLMLWLSQEVQGGSQFLRRLEREFPVASGQRLIEKLPELTSIGDQIKGLYVNQLQDRPYLSLQRLLKTVANVDDWQQFSLQITNLLTVMELNQKTCAVVTECQVSLHELLRLGLSQRVSTVQIDLTVLNSAPTIKPLLGAGFTQKFKVEPKSVNSTQALTWIHDISFENYEASLNQRLVRLSDSLVAALLTNLESQLNNLPNGDRGQLIRNALENAALTTSSVIWDSKTDLTGVGKKVGDILNAIRNTTNKGRLNQLEKDLKAVLKI